MNFESPQALFLLAFPVLALFLKILSSMKLRRDGRQHSRPHRRGLPFPDTGIIDSSMITLRQAFLWLPVFFALTGSILLIIALARPRERLDESRKVTSGIAAELVIDRSGSMAAEVEKGGSYVRRIDVVKQNILDFIQGDGKTLSGRPDDMLGLVAFAKYADTLAPLSLSHDVVSDFIRNLDTVTTKEEDGTSIGDAIALASARLKTVNSNNDSSNGYEIKSRIIVLLTDGENNGGKYSPREAAELAADWGIKIYAIGFGGDAYYQMSSLFGSRRVPVGSAVDSATLKKIAEISGGAYFEADTPEDLKAVYEEIDSMEKSEIISVSEYRYRELFYLFAIAGIIFLAAGAVLDNTVFRRIS